MIRFKLALAGILIAPALAPAQDPKATEPSTISGAELLPERARTYLDGDLVPYGTYSAARPASGAMVFPTLKPAKPSHDNPLQANFGLQLAPADDALRAQLEIPAGRGAVVVGIKPGSLAEQAGLKPNDVLIKLGDREVDGVESATKALLGLGKEALEVKLIREGKPSRMSLVGPEHGFPPESAEYWIGVPVSPVDATLHSHLPALKLGVGLIVNDVVKGSPAEAAGLLKNDILVTMGGKPLTNLSLIEQIQAAKGQPISLEILRGGKSITINVTPARRAHPTTINLPGSRTKTLAYWLREPQVAVEVNPKEPQADLAKKYAALPGQLQRWDLVGVPNWSQPGIYNTLVNPDISYDAIVVNPYRVDGANLSGIADRPYDIRLRMAPRADVNYTSAGDATARIEARLNEITAKLEEIRKTLDGIKKADGK